MKSLRNVASQPVGIPILADQILEFHAARLLLLLRVCGTKNRIDGLTKLAKLDFFVRYPAFFARLTGVTQVAGEAPPAVESTMVRHHYGPWDKRYYHVLAFLSSTGLLRVARGQGRSFSFELTSSGLEAADRLVDSIPFGTLVDHMRAVRKQLGAKTGTALKDLIYRALQDEVTHRPLGERIE